MKGDPRVSSASALLTQISLAMGQVRAEYTPDETIFSTFSWPVYWGELVGVRPCVLMGGRGTGKTTALRGLAYGGQASLRGPDLATWDTIGAYWRVDSMVVSAFAGRGQTDEQWTAAFSHYVNLKLVSLFLQFCEWYQSSTDATVTVSEEALYLTAMSLNVPPPSSLDELSIQVRRALATLEARLNGATADLFSMHLSVLGRPLAYLLEGLTDSDPLKRLPFTYCVDEFENFRPYQQRVINTLIKHVGDSSYTFKIGIRDSEQRDRDTLAAGQPLLDPADYTIVDIVSHLKDQSFVAFASMVCESRLDKTDLRRLEMASAFPGLSLEAEARLLGAERDRSLLRQRVVNAGALDTDLSYFDGMTLISACMVGYWSQAQSISPLTVLREAASNERAWDQRVGNHSYAMLFTFRQGVRGIKKYYTGWSTYCQLANGNIRLLLELVYEGLRAQISETGSVLGGVSYANQTRAASDVGRTTLRELQGQSGSGGQLTRLTLSMGRIFNVFAATPEGHAPEVNQIRIDTAGSTRSMELTELLREAVANGCLVSFPGDKQERVSSQTKSLDYQLHPIFSAYFIYSHRRKRRIQLRADEVVALSEEGANRAIDLILKDRRRDTPDLPEQLEFYAGFYEPID